MKKLCVLISCAFLFLSFSANAKINGLYFKPAVTLEYSAPSMSGSGANADFKTNNFGKQISNFENIAVGFHARIHKYVGLNFNYARTDLSNTALQDVSLSQKARFAMSYYNLSVLGFLPIDANAFELFGEAGISKTKSKLSVFDAAGNFSKNTDDKYIPFIGGGVQFFPFKKSKDSIRFSALRYLNKIPMIDTNFTVVRLGYIKTF